MKDLITIDTIPEELYIELDDKAQEELWNKLSSKTVVEISKEFRIPVRNLYKYKEGNSGYPAKYLKHILRKVGINPTSIFLKTRRDSKKLKMNIPVKCSKHLAEFLGHLLGDGGIDNKSQVHYTTNDERFLKRFDFLISEIFGEVDKKIYDYTARKTYYYPKVIGVILKNIGFAKGSKVKSNVGVPQEIFNLFDKKMKIEFIRAFYECDGESKYIRIIQGGCTDTAPLILTQIKNMLTEFGFQHVIIQPSSVYHTNNGLHRRWVLRIDSRSEKVKFKRIIKPLKLS